MIASSLLSHRVFAAMPHVQDSIAQLFQARIFASGALRAAAPDLPQFFQYHHMILADGHWYSQYPPGHPFALLLGVWIGAPWIVDPVMGGLFVVALVLLGPEVFDRAEGIWVGRVAGLLALLSPFFLLMSAEFMSHPTALAGATWGLLGYLRLVRTGALRYGALAGAGLGLALLARPYSAFGIGLPIVLHGAWSLIRARRARGSWVTFFATGALAVLILLGYNAATNGSPFVFGYESLYGSSHGLGFGKGSWGPSHTLARGLGQAGSQLAALHHRLFEWPLTSLWPLVLGLLPGPAMRRRLALLLLPVSLLAVHVFYWYSDLCFGPRYLYEALGPILLLSAWGLVRLASGLLRNPDGRFIGAFAMLLLAVPSVLGMATRWPSLFEPPASLRGAPPGSPLRAASYFQYFGPAYWGVGPALHRVVERDAEIPALVFTRFAEPKIDHPTMRHLQYGCGFAFQEPDLSSAPVIYAQDLGPENEVLARSYPSRTVYLYEGSVESGTLRRIRGGNR